MTPAQFCQGIDSRPLETHLLSGDLSAVLCNFSIFDFACSSSIVAANISAKDLATLLTCKLTDNMTFSKEIWTLFFQRFATPLDEALDIYANTTPNVSLSDSHVLDAICEVKVNNFSAAQLTNVTFISEWFQIRLRPFLSSVSTDFLSILNSKNFSCETYQVVVAALSTQEPLMTEKQKKSIYTDFIHPFLSGVEESGQSCVQSTSNDSDWLVKNFGKFISFASFSDFISLRNDFNGVNAAHLLSLSQLADLSSTPSQLQGPQDVNTVMAAVSPNQFTSFFDIVTPKVLVNESQYSTEEKEAFLQSALVRGGLSSSAVPDSEVLQWLNVRLSPFLSSLSSTDVTPYFSIIKDRNCTTIRAAVRSLNSLSLAFNNDTQTQIFKNIQLLLSGPNGLQCYTGGSFYAFLKGFFLSFGFPDLSNFLSLIPANRKQELLGSISPGELKEFLSGQNTVKNESDLCTLLSNYNNTNQYLEKEPVGSAELGRQTLGCVWSGVLSASSQDEVNQWFNVTLTQYLPFLNSQLISPTQLSSASCLSYKKLISFLGNSFNFSATDFTPAYVYSSIKVYLNSSDGTPRCYNPSDPFLNSTAWFVNNIGKFITFITLTDLKSFVSESQMGVFLNNSENIQLFNNSKIAADVTTFYGSQLYIENPNFNPLSLLGVLLCGAPAYVFEPLGPEDSQTVLDSLNTFCSTVDPQVRSTLAANFPTLSKTSLEVLGNQSLGLTEGQLSAASPDVINSSLSQFSTVTGWNQGQINILVQSISKAGFGINSAPSLISLGTLIGGVSAENISNVPTTELLKASQNPTFINNIQTAPVVLQETYVEKIISADQAKVVENVPDALASYIPPVLLSSPTTVNVALVNKKSWNQEQAVVLFGPVASATEKTEELSEAILQGFTCSSVQSLPVQKIKNLVKDCRPRTGRSKVPLKESQLTCMYNYVKDDTTLTFTDLPSDMLLYYSYDKVQKRNCRSYFTALGVADFSVPSRVLNIQSNLFKNAQDCLSISGKGLNRDQVEVLGNMICTLNPSYIQNSDPLIVEKLKKCADLSDDQITALQTLLYTGKTPYGNPSTWNPDTLNQLDILPVYFKQDYWGYIPSSAKKTFLKTFIPGLRKQKIPIDKQRRLFTEYNIKYLTKIRRSTACTKGIINDTTIADPSFPIGYDSNQFDACLDTTALKNNPAAITEKVVDMDFLKIILNKLKELYPSGLPENVVMVLDATSRVATVNDINTWSISNIDTLSALMDPKDGGWTSDQSKALITKYLSVKSNSLKTPELNAVGSYLCSVDVSVIKNISPESLKKAKAINMSSCSIEQKSAMYSIAKLSFSSQMNDPVTYYQLISSYLGGAPLEDIQALASHNVSMDLATFRSLKPDVLKVLNVSTVRNLLGVNLPDLKLFENTTEAEYWTSQIYKSQLATLNLGLVGGKNDLVITTATATTSTNITTIYNNTTGSSVVHRGSGPWVISLCVGLLTITLHILR